MTIANTKVVDNTSKHIVKSQGIGSETDQVMVNTENLISGNNKSLVSVSASTTTWSISFLIPCDLTIYLEVESTTASFLIATINHQLILRVHD